MSDQPKEPVPGPSGAQRSKLRYPRFAAELMLKALTGPMTDLKLKREQERNEPSDSSPHTSSPESDSTAPQEGQEDNGKRELDEERAGLRLWRTTLLFLSFILPLAAWYCGFPTDRLEVSDWKWIGGVVFVEIFFLVSLLAARTRLLTIRTELARLEYEKVLDSLPLEEQTAADLFFKHQFELKQYYDQALRQHRQAFTLGVTCVLFGLGVVVVAITTLGNGGPKDAEVAISILGGVGALLSGAVASIYLAMYAGTTKSLQTFHQRLVRTNRMHLAYLFAAGIEDDQLKMKVLGKLAELTVTTNDEVEQS